MSWTAEIILELFLCAWLVIRPDGRRWFQALLWANLFFEGVYFALDRTSHHTEQARVWWALIVIECPLYAMTIREACRMGRTWHINTLAWWIAGTMACAWIRWYPYTGATLIWINDAAFLAWIAGKALMVEP